MNDRTTELKELIKKQEIHGKKGIIQTIIFEAELAGRQEMAREIIDYIYEKGTMITKEKLEKKYLGREDGKEHMG